MTNGTLTNGTMLNGTMSGNETMTNQTMTGNETMTNQTMNGNETMTNQTMNGNETMTNQTMSSNETMMNGTMMNQTMTGNETMINSPGANETSTPGSWTNGTGTVQTTYASMTNESHDVRHDVICGQTEMSFSIPLPDDVILQKVTLSDPDCAMTQSGGVLSGTTPLNDCGTTLRFTQHSVVFSNQALLTYLDNSTGLIPITCSYNRSADLRLDFLPIVRRVLFTEQGVGQFAFRMQQFSDASFSSPLSDSSYPLRVTANQRVFLQLSAGDVSHGDDLYGVDVEACLASSSPSVLLARQTQHVQLVKDGCATADDVNIIPTGTQHVSHAFRFSFHAVPFPRSNTSAPNLLYVHCRLQICPKDKCPTQDNCSQQGSGHHLDKRSIQRRSREAIHLSAGPFLTDQAQADGKTSEALLVTLSLFTVISSLVAIATLVAWRRSVRGQGHRLLKVTTQEQ